MGVEFSTCQACGRPIYRLGSGYSWWHYRIENHAAMPVVRVTSTTSTTKEA